MKNEQVEGLTWLSAGEARRISWRRRCPPPVNQSVIVVNKAIDAAINYAVFQALLPSFRRFCSARRRSRSAGLISRQRGTRPKFSKSRDHGF